VNKRKPALEFDPLTEQIKQLLLRIPKLGKSLAAMYLWKPMLFNFMIVGASGTVLNWILYEFVFRNVLLFLWGGTFIAMVITTLLVFFWNYSLNKRWSLKPDAQIMKMKKHELMRLKDKIERLLSETFDNSGNRM
jgi:hypothetical protein